MYTSVYVETQFFMLSIFAGIVSAFLYDILRISRRIVPVSDTVINIQDILFFAVAAMSVFIAAYLKNSGEIRWQSFIGFALGITLYIVIVRNRLLNISTVLIRLAVKILRVIISIILFPLRIIFRIFRKPISVIVWYTDKGFSQVKNIAKTRRIKMRTTVRNLKFMFRKNKK